MFVCLLLSAYLKGRKNLEPDSIKEISNTVNRSSRNSSLRKAFTWDEGTQGYSRHTEKKPPESRGDTQKAKRARLHLQGKSWWETKAYKAFV